MVRKCTAVFLSVALALSAAFAAPGCGSGSAGTGAAARTSAQAAEQRVRAGEVVVAMDPDSEPAAGFDPAYGWGAGEHVHEPLIQSTLTVTNPDLTIGYDLATN